MFDERVQPAPKYIDWSRVESSPILTCGSVPRGRGPQGGAEYKPNRRRCFGVETDSSRAIILDLVRWLQLLLLFGVLIELHGLTFGSRFALRPR